MKTNTATLRLRSKATLVPILALLLGMLAACGGSSNSTNGGVNGTNGGGGADGSSLPPGTELLYVGDNIGQIHGFSVDANSGALTPVSGSPFAVTNLAAASDVGLAADPSGTALYATSAGLGGPNVVALTVNPNTGALTPVAANQTLPASPIQIAVDPEGKNAYVIANTAEVWGFSIDARTHGLTALPSQPTRLLGIPHGITVDPSGAFVYISFEGTAGGEIAGISRDTSTGALSLFESSPTSGDSPQGIRVTPDGKFVIVINQGTPSAVCSVKCVSVFSLDPGTGALSEVPGSPFASGDGPGPVAIDPSGKFVFVGNTASNSLSAYTLGSAGALTAMTGTPIALGSIAQPDSIAVDPADKFVYVSIVPREVSGFTLNSSTGALTAVTGSPFSVGQVTRDLVVVKP